MAKQTFDADFARRYFTSQADLERGIVNVPAVGDTFGLSVAAPGRGKIHYKITRVNDDGSLDCVCTQNTAREMTAGEAR